MNSYYMDVNVTAEQRRDRIHAAEEKMLLQQSGLLERGWLARGACTMLCRAGQLLVNSGQAVIRYAAASGSTTVLSPRMPDTAAGR